MRNRNAKPCIFNIFTAFCIGVTISYIIELVISYYIGTGEFYPVSPMLISRFGNELTATFVQTLIGGFLGVFLGAFSMVWNLEHWSLLRRTVVHFFMTFIMVTTVSGYMGWISFSVREFLIFLLIFLLVYLVIWIAIWLSISYTLKKLNKSLHN